MKKHLLKLLAIFTPLLLILSGCGGNGASSDTSDTPDASLYEKEVILAAHRDLTPGEKDGYYTSLITQVWEPLVTLGEDGAPEAALATDWEMSDDGTEWRLSLREGVTFHDGEPFNADAVIANIERVLDHSPKKSPFYTIDAKKTYPDLDHLEKVDEHTVKLVFSVPSPSAINRLTNFGSPMTSPAGFDENGDFSGIVKGTGPFMIVEHEPDQYTLLEANTNYWGDAPKVKNVRILSMPAAETRASALRSGEIHGVLDIGAILPSQAVELTSSDEFVASSTPSTITHFFQVNQSRAPFDDPRMIQAMSLAIDRELIVNEFYHGYGVPSANTLNASALGYVQDEVQYDPEKAKELASEVLGDERVSVELLVPQYGVDRYPYKEQAEYVQSVLSDIGVDIEISIVEGSEQSKRRSEGNFDMSFHTQGMPDGDPVTMLNVFMGEGNGGRYDNQEARDLLYEARTELDPDRRFELYGDLQELALETRPTLPLLHDHYLIVHTADLVDYNATHYGVTLDTMYWAR